MALRGLPEMCKNRHCADKRYRRIASPERRQNMGCGAQGSSRSAITRGHRAFEKSSLMNGANPGPGKLTGLIRIRCGFGKDARGCVECGGVIGHADSGFLMVGRRDHPSQGWMIPVLEERWIGPTAWSDCRDQAAAFFFASSRSRIPSRTRGRMYRP